MNSINFHHKPNFALCNWNWCAFGDATGENLPRNSLRSKRKRRHQATIATIHVPPHQKIWMFFSLVRINQQQVEPLSVIRLKGPSLLGIPPAPHPADGITVSNNAYRMSIFQLLSGIPYGFGFKSTIFCTLVPTALEPTQWWWCSSKDKTKPTSIWGNVLVHPLRSIYLQPHHRTPPFSSAFIR